VESRLPVGASLLAALSIILLLSVNACGPEVTPTKPPPTAPGATAPVVTIGDLATAGKIVYATRCARCHGGEGQGNIGPPLFNANATLERFGNARILWDFTSTSMPFDAPGSLPQKEYEQVLSYLLIANNFALEKEQFYRDDLQNLVLKRRLP
jgi:hypothetical protein